MILDEQQVAETAARYTRFAEYEVRGRSPLYEQIARGVAADRDVVGFLLTLPAAKRQPNLLLAAVRHLFGTPADWAGFRTTLLANADAVGTLMRARSTQTNEPARCATLLPILARLPQPLALIEVGASAGLCLLPDFYGYDYPGTRIRPVGGTDFPIFACATNVATPIPPAMPVIAWRAGLDLNPLDAADPSDVAWLETLVWPEQTSRLANLRTALKLAVVHKPRVVKGDLLGDDLERLCGEAPRAATLVIFHTAVLAYLGNRVLCEAFAARALRLCRCWISNEYPNVFLEAASRARMGGPAGHLLMSVNGKHVAWTEPHGASLEWMADAVGLPDRSGA